MTVTGVDMNRDGIPDVLQQQAAVSYAAPAPAVYAAPAPAVQTIAAAPAVYAAPQPVAAAPTVYGAPTATATVTGVDMNRDGIPDVLQQQPRYVVPGKPVNRGCC